MKERFDPKLAAARSLEALVLQKTPDNLKAFRKQVLDVPFEWPPATRHGDGNTTAKWNG